MKTPIPEIDFELEDVNAELASRDFREFLAFTFPKYKWSWHSKLMARELDLVAKGKTKKLIITAPPRYGKSEQVSRRLPAFFHGLYPDKNIIGASYGADLSKDMNRDIQKILESDLYHKVFPDTQLNAKNVVTTKSWLKNSETYQIVEHGGKYVAAGAGGALTGKGGHLAILDDPFKNSAEADSPTIREKIWRWYVNVFQTRLMDFEDGSDFSAEVIIMTRWHEDDIVGRIKEKMKKDPSFPRYKIIELEAIKEDNEYDYDHREVGEPLWPAKHKLEKLQQIRAAMGTRDFNSLYQQKPSASEGQIIKKTWIKYYDNLPDYFNKIIMSWDCAFKDRKDSDYVAGVVLGIRGPNKYILDFFRERADFPATIRAIENMAIKFPNYHNILIEDAANGPAILSVLKKKFPRLIGVTPRGSKQARLESCAPEFESGNVLYPVDHRFDVLLEELFQFPFGKNDDTVDATSQVLNHLRSSMRGKLTDDFIPESSAFNLDEW